MTTSTLATVYLTFLLFICTISATSLDRARVFEISGDQFKKDGKPFVIVSGSFHYFRIHPGQWEDRLMKAKEGGLNTIETYVAWNLHEPKEGVYNWEGPADIVRFLKICQKLGLLVILRPTPYICAEWEFGGFPFWLLNKPDIGLRSNDPAFMDAHNKFMDQFAPLVKPLQYNQYGGPIIMLQIENEYLYYGTDMTYLRNLKKCFDDRGLNKMIYIMCGAPGVKMATTSLPETLRAINVGPGKNVDHLIKTWRKYQKTGPALVTEYYAGWLDHWSQPHSTRSLNATSTMLEEFLSRGISVNFYMYHGGTNFGFWAGANGGSIKSDPNLFNVDYQPITTSYDYDAPLSESGEPTAKYFAYRDIIKRLVKNEVEIPPKFQIRSIPPKNYGRVTMTSSAPLISPASLSKLSLYNEPNNTAWPTTMEHNGQDYGFILYRTTLLPNMNAGKDVDLKIPGVRDRAMIWAENRYAGNISRNNPTNSLRVPCKSEGTPVDILVENMGRIGFSFNMQYDFKGMPRGVFVDGNYQFNWTTWSLPLKGDDVAALKYEDNKIASPKNNPTFFRGYFDVSGAPSDTFLRLKGWTKGLVWVNQFNLGRYWTELGPQETLYVPSTILKTGRNEMIVMELHSFENPFVELQDYPILNGTVRKWY